MRLLHLKKLPTRGTHYYRVRSSDIKKKPWPATNRKYRDESKSERRVPGTKKGVKNHRSAGQKPEFRHENPTSHKWVKKLVTLLNRHLKGRLSFCRKSKKKKKNQYSEAMWIHLTIPGEEENKVEGEEWRGGGIWTLILNYSGFKLIATVRRVKFRTPVDKGGEYFSIFLNFFFFFNILWN